MNAIPEHLQAEVSPGADYEQLAGRFRPVFERIRAGAAERERERRLPTEQIGWLKEAGFGAVRVPVKYGGAGASIPQLFELLIELSAVDSNIAQALRGHFAFVEDRLVAHRDEPQTAWFERFVAGELVGNAWSEIGDARIGETKTKLSESDAGLVLNGTKYYSTGSIYADWIDVYAERESDKTPVIAVVSTHQDGVSQFDDWDGFGQRTTGSGTSVFADASVDPAHVTVFEDRFSYQTAFYQLVLNSVLAGSIVGAAREIAELAARRTRVYSHGSAAEWNQDPLVQQTLGIATSQGFAATATNVRAAESTQRAYLAHFLGDADREEQANQQAELDSAQAQVVLVDLSLEATSKTFGALGASGLSEQKGLDRFWRNARTAASHNPVAFKQRIVGDWAVNGTPPVFIWAVGTAKK